LIYFTL